MSTVPSNCLGNILYVQNTHLPTLSVGHWKSELYLQLSWHSPWQPDTWWKSSKFHTGAPTWLAKHACINSLHRDQDSNYILVLFPACAVCVTLVSGWILYWFHSQVCLGCYIRFISPQIDFSSAPTQHFLLSPCLIGTGVSSRWRCVPIQLVCVMHCCLVLLSNGHSA